MSALDSAALHARLAGVLASVTNYPRPAQVHLLGQDMGDVIDLAVDAVLALADETGAVILTSAEARTALDWYIGLPVGVTATDVALAQRLRATS